MLCLPLGAAGASLELAGGKGASLAKLVAAGLPVPPGFVLTTAAYRSYVAANNMQADVLRLARSATGGTPAALEQASQAIGALFEGGTMPREIAAAIGQAYAALAGNQAPVAVRSSATAEDLPGLSFAGQQETYLNMTGDAALIDAVRRCWASLWTPRAISYRNRMSIDHEAVAMGVVVQVMVAAEVSGVLFTANPTTGERTEMVANASFGLGEAIVSGQVTPDTVVLDRATLEPKETVVGAKSIMIVAAEGQGTVTQDVSAARQSEPALPLPLLRQLATLALRVEANCDGAPQDIEWAVADGQCWLLQARPITNLPPAPLQGVTWAPPIPGSAWVRRQIVEHLPEPLTPLFADVHFATLDEAIEQFQSAQGLPDSVRFKKPGFAAINGYAYMRGDTNIRWSSVPALLKSVVTGVREMFREGAAQWQRAVPVYLDKVAAWQSTDLAAATDADLLAGIAALSRADAEYWFPTSLAMGGAKMTDGLLEKFLSTLARGRGLTSGLFLRGFPSNTLESEADMEAMADRIRRDSQLRDLVAATDAQHLPEVLESLP
ncbi:MAG TPA: PEP/pyruvate-binding domain-containing protein, partial [Symbiobacteriaceae bacterium]|nr:PEP/pyruvate-binding domain-containing protein [Symbiobacteriaceae bacterium]